MKMKCAITSSNMLQSEKTEKSKKFRATNWQAGDLGSFPGGGNDFSKKENVNLV